MRHLGVMLSAYITALAFGIAGLALSNSLSVHLYAQSSASKTKLSSQSKKSSLSSHNPVAATVLATVGKESITYGVLEEMYRKNMNAKGQSFAQLPIDSAKDFLNLYINYRLKVQDAVERGFDKKPDIVADIQNNRTTNALPYLLDRKLVNPNVDTMLNRRKWQFRVGLILCAIKSTDDTLPAFRRAQKIIELVTKGKQDFMKVLKDSTDDEYGKQGNGDYGILTSGQLIRDIEDVIYTKLKVGDVYKFPIRTPYGAQPGYFVVKLLEIEPRVNVLGRQIVIPLRDSSDTAAVKRTADSILRVVRSGGDFAAIAKAISSDRFTGENGGLFPGYYSALTGYLNGLRYKIRPSIVRSLYRLKDGEVDSTLVQTDIGYHIVRRDSSKIGGDDREVIKRYYKQFLFENDRKAMIDAAKKRMAIKVNNPVVNAFLAAVDTSAGFSESQSRALPDKLLPQTLFSAKAGSITNTFSVQRFRDSLLQSSAVRGYTMNRAGVAAAIKRLTDDFVIETMVANLESEYPEFAALMREFHDGILIFRVEEQEVWSKMKFDTARARLYHDTIKTRFLTPVKYDFSEIFVKTDSAAQVVLARLKAGASFDSLAAKLTQREGYAAKKGRWEPLESWENLLADAASKLKVGDYTKKPIAFDNGFSICRLNAVIEPRQKTFEEAIPDFAAQFQDMVQKELSQKWLASLRQKYTVSIDDVAINKLWKRDAN
jgi:peptidyl-prolyl cis-trans isomerase SurA